MSTNAVNPRKPAAGPVVVGIDVGGTKTNATVLSLEGTTLVDEMIVRPSKVLDGPPAALAVIGETMAAAVERVGRTTADIVAIGLDTPGPASADGVLSARGSTNFSGQEWWGFDFRSAVEEHTGKPVAYCNDGNAAALYAHSVHFGPTAGARSSASAIVGTGLGGGVIDRGVIITGGRGMAGEFGHVHIPMDGLLSPDQPVPRCKCGFSGDVESVASLTGIRNNLLPYWLERSPDHPLHEVDDQAEAASAVRDLAGQRDELALRIFEQQAMALGRLFTILANVTDPDVFFVGGGITETDPWFRDWFLEQVVANITPMEAMGDPSEVALVPDLDMAGARGAALHALTTSRPHHG